MLQLPNFNSLAFVSLVAAVMSVTYSTVGWTTAVADGRIPGRCMTPSAAVKHLKTFHSCISVTYSEQEQPAFKCWDASCAQIVLVSAR